MVKSLYHAITGESYVALRGDAEAGAQVPGDGHDLIDFKCQALLLDQQLDFLVDTLGVLLY